MKKQDKIELEKISKNARIKVLDVLEKGCFIGSAYSCMDVLVYLYHKFLNIKKENLEDAGRDYFFLSKGHAVIGLYAVLNELGILYCDLKEEYLKCDSNCYLHPNRKLDGIEFQSGSLGHMISVAVGAAIDIKKSGSNNKVVVMTGDGELNEGTNWEGLLVASSQRLDNLIVIVDRNGYQANHKTEELIPLESLEDKFRSFGCSVKSVDGHSFEEIETVLQQYPFEQGKVSVIIANTVRGKGIKSFENDWDKWFVQLSDADVQKVREELEDEL